MYHAYLLVSLALTVLSLLREDTMLYVIRELEAETTAKHHHTPSRMLEIINQQH